MATPLTWEELEAGVDPQAFTVATVPPRIAQQERDPWEEYAGLRQALPGAKRASALRCGRRVARLGLAELGRELGAQVAEAPGLAVVDRALLLGGLADLEELLVRFDASSAKCSMARASAIRPAAAKARPRS